MLYKVGDKVRVRKREEIKDSKNVRFIDQMKCYVATDQIVVKAVDDRLWGKFYELSGARSETGGYWVFLEDWLEDAGPEIEITENEFMDMFD